MFIKNKRFKKIKYYLYKSKHILKDCFKLAKAKRIIKAKTNFILIIKKTLIRLRKSFNNNDLKTFIKQVARKIIKLKEKID